MRVTDEMVWTAVCAWRDVYEAEYMASGSIVDNDEQAMKAALTAALSTLPEDAGRAAEVECLPDDSYEAAQVERRELWKQRVDELIGELSKNLRQAFAEASAAPTLDMAADAAMTHTQENGK